MRVRERARKRLGGVGLQRLGISGEDGKVAIRNIRKGAMKDIKKMEKALGKDAIKDAEDSVAKSTKKFEGEVDKLVAPEGQGAAVLIHYVRAAARLARLPLRPLPLRPLP